MVLKLHHTGKAKEMDAAKARKMDICLKEREASVCLKPHYIQR